MKTDNMTPLESVAHEFGYGIAFPSRCARIHEALVLALERLENTRGMYSQDEEAQEALELELAIGGAKNLVALESTARLLLKS